MDHLCDLLAATAGAVGDRPAVVVDGGRALTFAQWDDASSSAARGLRRAGVGRGDRVLLLVGNADTDIYRIAYMATLRAGAVAVPVNPRVARRELEHMASDSGAVAAVAAGDQLERARALRSASPAPSSGSGLRTVVGPGATGEAEVEWSSLLAAGGPEELEPVGHDELSDILYTSGTTGLPRGVAITHRSVAAALASAPMPRASTLLHAAPVATFMATHGIQALVVQFGLTELVLPSFDTARFAQLVASERPEWITMVPAHALLLLESGALNGVDTSATTVVMFGGAPMPYDAIKGLAAAFPRAGLVNGYGLTESGTTVVAMPPGEAVKRPGAVGKPFDPKAVRVVGDDGADVPTGATGEVLVRVPPGQRRYHNDPEGTAAAWRGEWLHTGDLGHFDEAGYLFLSDRKKDVIVRGGYNVSTIEVENAIHEHPDVVEAAVVGIPHRVLGQDVAAVVRLRHGAALRLPDLTAFLADRLTDYKRPRHLVVSDEPLPRNAMGKLDKRAVRQHLSGGPAARAAPEN